MLRQSNNHFSTLISADGGKKIAERRDVVGEIRLSKVNLSANAANRKKITNNGKKDRCVNKVRALNLNLILSKTRLSTYSTDFLNLSK